MKRLAQSHTAGKRQSQGLEPSLSSARSGAPPPCVGQMPVFNWDVRPSQTLPSDVWGNPVPRGLGWIRGGYSEG